jgi:hypothetical protein
MDTIIKSIIGIIFDMLVKKTLNSSINEMGECCTFLNIPFHRIACNRPIITYLLRNVPGHVNMAFKLIHPHLCHSQSIAPHMGCQVLCVGLMGTLDMGNPGTGKDLNAAPTLPHLVLHIALLRTDHIKCNI